MANDVFIPLKEYRVKKKSDGEIYRMFGLLSFNQYGEQGPERFSFHVLTRNGVEIIPGSDAELLPLRWWQKDSIVAGIIGGVIGVALRELIPIIMQWLKL